MREASNLSQLVSQVHGFINEHSKRRSAQDQAPLDLFFDFPLFYGQTGDPHSRSRTATPDLTSGSSEEDGAPSPGPNVDTFRLKDDIKKVKQQDDLFTVPQRDIRPKGELPYPSNIQMDHFQANASGFLVPQGVGEYSVNAYSSMATPSSSKDSRSMRGKRTGPLKNSEDVAEVRKIGACSRCKARKVKCEQGAPCRNCLKDADKYYPTGGVHFAHRLCSRRPFSNESGAFHAISKIPEYNWHVQSFGERSQGRSMVWLVSFESTMTLVMSQLQIPIVSLDSRGQYGSSTRHTYADRMVHNYAMSADNHPPKLALVDWATTQIKNEIDAAIAMELNTSFQCALDQLSLYCLMHGQSALSHLDTLRTVWEMRCMYKIWRQRTFLSQRGCGQNFEVLPSSIDAGLKNMAMTYLKVLEPAVLRQIAKLEQSSGGRSNLACWVSLMQCILLYRDLFDQLEPRNDQGKTLNALNVTKDIFTNLVVTCEIQFGKKSGRPEKLPSDSMLGTDLNQHIDFIDSLYADFLESVRESPRPLDGLMLNLFTKVPKVQRRSNKRVKRSG
ncbi:hypothetical protein F4780DRAFT_334872 [Xylariomycetidae sp. FL0641]|nr:hypothetical protein F4780DRAFT_334872 [Xylariomycetidae sp. FL0641]